MRPVTRLAGLFLLAMQFHCIVSRGQDSQLPAAPTIRANVRLVSLDVIVTDKNGQPVPGLRAEDFRVRENGHEQKILKLEQRLAASNTGSQNGSQANRELTAATFTNKPADGEPVWNVILYDLLDTATDQQERSRKYLWQFIKTLPPEQPIAFVRMDANLRVLVPFKAGAGAVDKLLASSVAGPESSPLLEIYNPDDEALMRHIQAKMPDHGAAQQAGLQAMELEKMSQRVQTVLGDFNSLAKWLSKYPGKKNVYWLSTGFPLVAVPQSHGGPSTSFRGIFASQQREMDKNLQLARIAIFPIDVRGVLGDYDGMRDATHNSGLYASPGGAQILSADMDAFEGEQRQEIMQMLDIAEATGGVAAFNRNDIDGMLRSAFQQSQNFYTIAYAPPSANWNGDYRKIEISMVARGYHLAYRRGYYAIDLPTKPPTLDEFTVALRKGAAPSTGVLFSTKLKKANDSLVLNYVVDIHTLQFSIEADGRQGAGLDCAVVEYDSAGTMLGTSEIHVDGKVKPGQWTRLEQTGFPAQQVVPLAPGTASLTVGIRDHSSGEFGNMEIALTK